MVSLKVCSLGSINLDFTIQTHSLPTAGNTVGGGHFNTFPGGKGANVALATKKMGVDTTLLGAVGNDDFANEALVLLKKSGVDLSNLVIFVLKLSITWVCCLSTSSLPPCPGVGCKGRRY